MKKNFKYLLIFIIIVNWIIASVSYGQNKQQFQTALPTPSPSSSPKPSPLAANGQLHVCGLKLCNQYNQVIQLRSMANLSGGWMPACNTPETINYAASIGVDIIRLNVVADKGDDSNTAQISKLIQAATSQGIYVLVDWHDEGDPRSTRTRAVTFFDWLSRTYGNQANILYEPYNEPSNVSWSIIKQYHQVVVNTIRANDPDNIILLGNEGWSKQPLRGDGAQRIKNDPVQGSNLMYTVHIYAEQLKEFSLTTLTDAANLIPLFFTEWAYYSYLGGTDGLQPELGQAWVDTMRQLNISWISWWFIDGSDPAWFLTPGSCTTKNYSLRSPTGPQTLYWQNNPADSWSQVTPTRTPTPTFTPFPH